MFQGTHRRVSAVLAASFCAVALVAAGCGDDDDGGTTSAAGGSTGETAGAETTLGKAELDWGVQYTGGTAGKADPSKPKFVIGFANQQGGTPAYPESTEGAKAAVKFINEQLGGINGGEAVLKTCFILAEEDGQKCGGEFANDPDTKFVVMGLAGVGGGSLFKTLVPKYPVLVATPAGQPDQTTKGVYTLSAGSVAPIIADAVLAAKVPGAKRAAVVHSNNPIGTFTAEKLLKPAIAAQGLQVKLVPVSDTATTPDVVSAVQASGAAQSQVFQMTTIVNQCVSSYDALKQLGISPTVITTYQCSQPAMTKHLDGKLPEGWVFTKYGSDARVPNAKDGTDTYVAGMKAVGAPDDVLYNGDASLSFATIMTIAKFANELGEGATTEALKQSILDFKGPMMMQPGDGALSCGKISSQFIGVCSSLSAVTKYENGKLVNQEPVDIAQFVK